MCKVALFIYLYYFKKWGKNSAVIDDVIKKKMINFNF